MSLEAQKETTVELRFPCGVVKIPQLAVLRAQRDAWRLADPSRGYREEVFNGSARVVLIENGDPVATADGETEHAALANAFQILAFRGA